MKTISARTEFRTGEVEKIGYEIDNDLQEVMLFKRDSSSCEEISFSIKEFEFLISKLEDQKNAN